MSISYWLEITLLSDTTFGRGDGLAGVVQQEVEHDMRTGLPIIKGRTIKGLLVEACADIRYALQDNLDGLSQTAETLFGVPGSTIGDTGMLQIANATLPRKIVMDIHQQVMVSKTMTSQEVLESLTTIRHQTAIDKQTESAKKHTLRSIRAVQRDTTFVAPVIFDATETVDAAYTALLGACAAGVRRGGLSRTRGLGRLAVRLQSSDGVDHLAMFEQWVQQGRVS